MNYKNSKVEFQVNVPNVVVLDTDPTKAKLNEREFKNDDGTVSVSKSYTYFCVGNKVIFASEKLHELFKEFKRGDALSITKAQLPGQRAITWKVQKADGSIVETTTNDYIKHLDELKASIDSFRDLLLKHLNEQQPQIKKDNQEETRNSDFDTDLRF